MQKISPASVPDFVETHAPVFGRVAPAEAKKAAPTIYDAYFGGSPTELLRDALARPAHYAEHVAELHLLRQGEKLEDRRMTALILRYFQPAAVAPTAAKPVEKPRVKGPVYEDGASAGDIILI